MTTVLLAVALLQAAADQLAARALEAAQAGDAVSAEKLWKEALGRAPNHHASLFNLGVMLHRQRRSADAVPLLDRAATVQPGYEVHLIRGQNLQHLERREEAIRAWLAALRFQPANVKLMQVVSLEYSKGRYFHEAAAMARQALRSAPNDLNLYLIAVKALQDAGNHDAASLLAAEAAAKFPDSARAQFEAGFHLQKRGATEKALAHLERAMALDANYEEPYYFYGDLLVRQSKYAESIEPLQKAIAIRPGYAPARVSLARALSNLDRVPEALVELESATIVDPKNAQPWVLLSQLYFRLGEEAKAENAKQTSLRLRREFPSVLEALQARPFPAR
ncbi:MAG: tetratricopeptide repeat protein [Acidobacteria bacterium]|nr:tetratricopeptide repeat protein [Acidobacteriota bacterium]